MILESIIVVIAAVIIDLKFGDPKNNFHPTSWIGKCIGKLVLKFKNKSENVEKIRGVFLVFIMVLIVAGIIIALNLVLQNIKLEIVSLILMVIVGIILLKTTIAIRSMERHSLDILESIEKNDLESARINLSKIVKRNTKNLDQNHIISGTLESISENTVDGITGPLFYYTFFGLVGAFVYRTVNTIDSMIGYKTEIFRDIGWFGANCDKILNYIPSRITSFFMIIAACILGKNWKNSYYILKRDCKKTDSPNAGYPIAALAGALGTKLEKINHYMIGDENFNLSKSHILSAISLMKLTTILFITIFTIPVMILLNYFGWWINV